jgi:hypothetical protein
MRSGVLQLSNSRIMRDRFGSAITGVPFLRGRFSQPTPTPKNTACQWLVNGLEGGKAKIIENIFGHCSSITGTGGTGGRKGEAATLII